ncbi:spore coat protein, partial [bacterium]|nr:spore coat protein [bacterium]
EGEGGIADALKLAQVFTKDEPMIVILGDNIIGDNIAPFVENFKKNLGAKILLKEVPDPQRFGVAEIENGKIARIVEKPKQPKSNLAVIGVYMYDAHVFEIIKMLKPSDRGELEITDVNNAYLREGKLSYDVIKGSWTDAGTFESLYRATRLIAEKK